MCVCAGKVDNLHNSKHWRERDMETDRDGADWVTNLKASHLHGNAMRRGPFTFTCLVASSLLQQLVL